MAPTVLSVASRALVEAYIELGLDGDALIASCGLSREKIFDPDARISAQASDTLWQHAFIESGDPLLSLHAAEALPFGAYRVLDYLASTADTVGAGLRAVVRYFPLVDRRARMSVNERGGRFVLNFETSEASLQLPQPAQEYTLAAILLRSREGTGLSWTPSAVHFTFPKPDDIAEYTRIFGCPLRFSQKTAGLHVAEATWNRASKGADNSLHALLEQHAQILFKKSAVEKAGLLEHVKEDILKRLREGLPTLGEISKMMGMSSKTLQRRLKEEDTTFADLMDKVRCHQAKLYLGDRTIAVAEVSWLLGFSEQSSFTRAFKRWTGQSPARWRGALLGQPSH